MFQDREEAGRLLAQRLLPWRGRPQTLVLAIPRGGVIVGREVAKALDLPLDLTIVRKIGFPGNPELAIGAVDLSGVVTFNEEIAVERIDPAYLRAEIEKELFEARRRAATFRGKTKAPNLSGQRVILVDDGVATGQTTQAAINYLRQQGVKEIILAVPVASPETAKRLAALADRTIILQTPPFFSAVGQFYREFPQVSDEEVREALLSSQGSQAGRDGEGAE